MKVKRQNQNNTDAKKEHYEILSYSTSYQGAAGWELNPSASRDITRISLFSLLMRMVGINEVSIAEVLIRISFRSQELKPTLDILKSVLMRNLDISSRL